MHIVLLCATERGYRFLECLSQLMDAHDQLTVCSFRETSWEPPYLERVQARAEELGATFYEVRNVSEIVWATPIDLVFMVSWRYLVPSAFYTQARLGSFVFHDSLLPAYRGFSPTVWAIINGEDHTGVSLFHASEAYDTGDIIAQQRVPIAPDETIADVLEHVTQAYLDVLTRSFPRLRQGDVLAQPQDHSLATYTLKWTPADAQLNWAWSTERIYNLIRATTAPYSGAFTTFEGDKFIIWRASRIVHPRRYAVQLPGRVVGWDNDGVEVLTGDGMLRIESVQRPTDAHPIPARQALKSLTDTLG